MSEKGKLKKVGTIKNNALGYDVGFDINYFLPDGTEMYILENDDQSGQLPRRDTHIQSGEWIWCKDKIPGVQDADEWGNIFFLLMEDEDEEPELVNIHDFLNTIEGKDVNTLPARLCFYWKRTDLTLPADFNQRKKLLDGS